MARLGLIGFGGPAAHLALMREEMIVRRDWVGEQEFLDLLGSAVCCRDRPHLSRHVARATASRLGRVGGRRCLLHRARHGHRGRARLGLHPIGNHLGRSGSALWHQPGRHRHHRPSSVGTGPKCRQGSRPPGRRRPCSCRGVPERGQHPDRDGRRRRGRDVSGYALLAFLGGDLAGHHGWITTHRLVDAVSVGQFTPGPVFTTATFIGYLSAGVGGAVVATVGIFTLVVLVRFRPSATWVLGGGAVIGLVHALVG